VGSEEASTLTDSLAAQAGLLVELTTAAIEPALRAAGLSLSGFDLLSAVAASAKGTQAEVSRRLGVSPGTLSEAVHAAVGRGLLVQRTDEGDARLRRLELTPQGREALGATLRAVNDVEAAMLAGIPEGDVRITRDVLRRAIRNLAEANRGQTS
jgi:DNA-binding MarR family transcriptional regulator